ncbi:MAG TPA: hypothetical protein VH741_11480 [Candidatus Limnocylindrales bacterium]|jgi:hypothetical protein
MDPADRMLDGLAYGDASRQAACTICGRPLGESYDDRPDWPSGPMCGDCYQSRQMDDETFWDDLDEE